MGPINNLLRIASNLRVTDPDLSRSLSNSIHKIMAHRRISFVNPGVKTFEEYIEQMTSVLKSLVQELETSLKDIDDSEKFKKFFTDGLAERKELEDLLDKSKSLGKTASSTNRTAGFSDWFKGVVNLFNNENEKDEEEGVEPSYTLDENMMNSFVDGSTEWDEASNYIESEFEENREFFNGAHKIIDSLDNLGDSPTEKTIKSIIDNAKKFIGFGERIIKGVRKHLSESTSDGGGDDSDSVKDVKEDVKEGVANKPQIKVNLYDTVDHYIDTLRDNLGNDKKTVSLLKELFSKVGPFIKEERGDLGFASRIVVQRRMLPILIKLASARPSARPFLIPIIKKAINK